MTHIRSIHGHISCKNYLKKKCRFSETCLYTHAATKIVEMSDNTHNKEQHFRLIQENLAPPDKNPQSQKKEMKKETMIPMLIKRIMPQIVKQVRMEVEKENNIGFPNQN